MLIAQEAKYNFQVQNICRQSGFVSKLSSRFILTSN
uniref:Uncharacterized protein n=1 Tax=Rhizophora mucronata TaxID=61149 RepID=A0A2P2ILC5_RHIMU